MLKQHIVSTFFVSKQSKLLSIFFFYMSLNFMSHQVSWMVSSILKLSNIFVFGWELESFSFELLFILISICIPIFKFDLINIYTRNSIILVLIVRYNSKMMESLFSYLGDCTFIIGNTIFHFIDVNIVHQYFDS